MSRRSIASGTGTKEKTAGTKEEYAVLQHPLISLVPPGGSFNSGITCLSKTAGFTCHSAWSCHHAISSYRSLFGCVFGFCRLLRCSKRGRSQERRQRPLSADRLPGGDAAPGNELIDQSQVAELRVAARAAPAPRRRGGRGAGPR